MVDNPHAYVTTKAYNKPLPATCLYMRRPSFPFNIKVCLFTYARGWNTITHDLSSYRDWCQDLVEGPGAYSIYPGHHPCGFFIKRKPDLSRKRCFIIIQSHLLHKPSFIFDTHWDKAGINDDGTIRNGRCSEFYTTSKQCTVFVPRDNIYIYHISR